jgi:hypothetical protein
MSTELVELQAEPVTTADCDAADTFEAAWSALRSGAAPSAVAESFGAAASHLAAAALALTPPARRRTVPARSQFVALLEAELAEEFDRRPVAIEAAGWGQALTARVGELVLVGSTAAIVAIAVLFGRNPLGGPPGVATVAAATGTATPTGTFEARNVAPEETAVAVAWATSVARVTGGGVSVYRTAAIAQPLRAPMP